MAQFNFDDEAKLGFQILPQGDQVLTITNVEYKQNLGHMIIDFKNPNGITHKETYRFIKNNGEPNDSARGIFVRLGRIALNKPQGSKGGFDHTELVGKSVIATVEHETTEYNGKNYTHARLKHFEPYVVEDDLDNL